MTDKPAEAEVAYFGNYDAKYGTLVADPHHDGVTKEWMRSARAAIAELKARIEELTEECHTKWSGYDDEKQRADEAEAALSTARQGELEAMTILEGTEANLAAAEERVEALKCCGNCGHNGGSRCCEPALMQQDGDNVILVGGGRQRCRFEQNGEPSRWQERSAR